MWTKFKLVRINCFLIVFCAIFCNCDEFFLVNSYAPYKSYCITNSTSALTWVDKDIAKQNFRFNIASEFIPKPNEAAWKYICDAKQTCKKSYSDKIIFDRRWEEIPIYTSDYVEDKNDPKSSLKFSTVANIVETSFIVPLSIRIAKEAHIFLCDGDNVSESNCYWFVLQGFGGNKSVLRKCPKNTIPSINGDAIKQPCTVNIAEKIGTNFLNNMNWNHFILSGSKNHGVSLTQINKNDPLMLQYGEDGYDVRYIIIHSKHVVGLWKIHELEYLYIEQTVSQKLGEPVSVNHGSVCISMFLQTCNFCKIKLELRETGSGEILKSDTFGPQPTWTEIKLMADYIESNKVDLYVSTVTDGGTTQNMSWSLSNIKSCHKSGFRMITFDDGAKCQRISETNVQTIDIGGQVTLDENKCPEDTISKYCVPLSWFKENSEERNLKICEQMDTSVKCSCSAGYKVDIAGKCTINCEEGYYGHNCQKPCGKCMHKRCHNIDGRCESCTDNYTGPQCIIPPAAFFKKSPNVEIVTYTSVEVHVSDFSLGNEVSNSEPENFFFQYKKNSDTKWTKWGENYPFGVEKRIKIDCLEPGTEYFIRCVIKTKDNGNEYFKDDVVPFSQFETKFQDNIDDEEVPQIEVVEVENRSARIKFSEIDCNKRRGPLLIKMAVNCSNEWCKNFTKINFLNYSFNGGSEKLSGLLPFSNFILKVEFCRNDTLCGVTRTEEFNTAPEAPYAVKELTVYSKNNNSISLKWKPPYPPSGHLERYNVKNTDTSTEKYYEFNTSNEKNPCDLWPHHQCLTLFNLNSQTEYKIQIKAKNQEISNLGQVATVSSETKIEPPGPPVSLHLNWTLANDMIIRWQHPFVSNGDISYFSISIIPHHSAESENRYEITNVTKPKRHYSHKIESNYIKWSRPYRIKVEAYNGYNGVGSCTEDISPPSIPLLEYEPELSSTNSTLLVKIPQLKDMEEKNIYKLLLLISDESGGDLNTELEEFQKKFDVSLSNLKILYVCDLTSTTISQFSIGTNDQTNPNCTFSTNQPLKSGTNYNVTILLINTFVNKTSYKLYTYIYGTQGQPANSAENLGLYALFLLLLIIPIAILIFIKRRPLKAKYNSLFGNISPDEEETPLATTPKKIPFGSSSKVHSRKIELSELEQYVKESLKNGELDRQHALFPRGQTQPWDRGALAENKPKNRYTNLMAYDHTRVILKKINGKEHSDYINANYIDGYQVRKAYIATQGPKLATVHDFWRMIWQENVEHIAMLANVHEGGKKKVEKYWPDKNERLPFGDLTVCFESSEVFADYEHRMFQVTCNKATRIIHQYHFSSWPDHGVPLYSQSLIPFLQTLQAIPLSTGSPILVHCSAGVGRTGTIILCDSCLRMAAKDYAVDMLRTLQQLRDQRPNMVDNIQQYKLSHLVILEYLFGLQTGIPCSQIDQEVKKIIEKKEITRQIRYLEETAWQDETMKSAAGKNKHFLIVKEKNRFQTIVPEIQGCVYLSRYPSDDDTSTYINAVSVDGFQCPGRFIVTQQPMPDTLGDFWRLIQEKEISVVISLNQINLKDKTSCVFWPSQSNPNLAPVDYITLEHINTLSLDSYNIVTIHMYVSNSEEYKIIEILSMKGWPAKINCPTRIENFLTFLEESQATSRQSNPVLVTCYDGALACGLYLTMSFVIEKMKLEQMCDVCQAVRAVRHNRNQFVPNEEQFEFLYRAAMIYINGFQSYANFN